MTFPCTKHRTTLTPNIDASTNLTVKMTMKVTISPVNPFDLGGTTLTSTNQHQAFKLDYEYHGDTHACLSQSEPTSPLKIHRVGLVYMVTIPRLRCVPPHGHITAYAAWLARLSAVPNEPYGTRPDRQVHGPVVIVEILAVIQAAAVARQQGYRDVHAAVSRSAPVHGGCSVRFVSGVDTFDRSAISDGTTILTYANEPFAFRIRE